MNETPIDTETFGERLRRLREVKGYTVTSLATRVGLTEAYLRQLEAGRTRDPRMCDGIRLADALGAEVRYLAFGDGDVPLTPPDLAQRVLAIERRLGMAWYPPR
jgi:transcriptional regulator with XRE-family HTH domain